MIPSHFFTVRLGIDWLVKVVIERLEVIVSVGVEVNLRLLLLLTQLARGGGHQPQLLRLRGVEETVEGPVVVHLRPLPGVLQGEIKEVHLAVLVVTVIITGDGAGLGLHCSLDRYDWRYDWCERWLSTDRPGILWPEIPAALSTDTWLTTYATIYF